MSLFGRCVHVMLINGGHTWLDTYHSMPPLHTRLLPNSKSRAATSHHELVAVRLAVQIQG